MIAGDFSHLRKENPEIEKDMQKQTIDGIDYYWLKTGSYQGNGAKRAMTMIRFCGKLIRYRKQINKELQPDVVISSSTYPIDSIPAHMIAVKGKKKATHIHEVHDMWPSTLTEIGGMSKWNPFVVLMQIGENYAYRHADKVVSLPKYAKEYMMKHGLAPDKFRHIANGIVSEEWNSPVPLPEEHKEILEGLRKSGKFVVGYFGGHALSNCLMTLIEAAGKIQDDRIHFVLVGDGVEKKRLMEAAEKLSNVTFLSPIDKRAIPVLNEYFDCTYIGAKDSPLYRFGACMNKMFDGMMAGKPLVFAINAPTTPVQDADCGIIIKPEDPDEIIKAIEQLVEMGPEKRAEMGARGRNAVLEEYTYEVLARRFAELF
jgi:glycosyltransferase involved in cell wall biosynthesis